MDKFTDNWLPNIVVNSAFWLFDHFNTAWAVVVALVYLLRKRLAQLKAQSTSGDLVPGAMSGSSLTASIATANVTPQYHAPPNLGQVVTEHDQWYSAVQDINRFERGKMAAVLANSEYQGSPRVLLDHPPTA